MSRPDPPRYRRTGPIPVQPVPRRPRRRLRRRWIAVFAVVLGAQAGWIGTIALADGTGPTVQRSATGTSDRSAPAASGSDAPDRTSPSSTASASPTASAAATPSASSGAARHQADTGAGEHPGASTDGRWFAADSPWNTPIGAGASYSAAGSALTRSLTADASRATINSTAWSVPYAIASTVDPLVRVAVSSGTTASHRMPADAAPSDDTDGELAVIDGTRSYEYWGLAGSAAGGWSARYGSVVDLTGSGTTGGVRASGFSLLGGLIRRSEVGDGIDHALVVALAADQLHTGPVLPATSQDGDAAASYSGEVHMGARVAIPRSVDLDSLGLSPAGLRLARALQRYGAYVGDRSSQLTLYAAPEAEGAGLAAMRAALRDQLAPLLRVVSNG